MTYGWNPIRQVRGPYGFEPNPRLNDLRVGIQFGDLEGQTCYTAPPKEGAVWVVTDLQGWWEPAEVATKTIDAPSGDGVLAFDDRMGPRGIIISSFIQAAEHGNNGFRVDELIECLSRQRRAVLRVVEGIAGVSREADVRLLDVRTNRRSGLHAELTISLQADDPLRYSSGLVSVVSGVGNFATNPGFESVLDWDRVRTNLATNPRLSTVADSTVAGDSVPELRVGCQNLYYSRYVDRPWAERKAFIAANILDSGQKLFGVQEVHDATLGVDSQSGQLVAELGDPWAFANGSRQNGFVWDDSVFELMSEPVTVTINKIFLQQSETSGERSLVWAVFRHRGSGRQFIMASTHFQVGLDAYDARGESAHLVGDLLRSLREDMRLESVVVGDFNSGATGPGSPLGILPLYGLREATLNAAEPLNAHLNSYNGWDPEMVGRQEGLRIDQMWVSEGVDVGEAGVWARFADGVGLPLASPVPSDHNMIVGRLTLQPRRAVVGQATQNPMSTGNGARVYTEACPVCGRLGLFVDPRDATGNWTSVYPALQGGAMGRLGWVPGGTYGVSASVCVPHPQTGPLGVAARAISIGTTVGGQTTTNAFASQQAPNERGTHRLAVSFTLPENAENAFIRLMNGSATRDDIIVWHDLFISEGQVSPLVSGGEDVPTSPIAPPYFDGDSPDSDNVRHVWEGTPGMSRSHIMVRSPRVQGGTGAATEGGGALVYASQEWASQGQWSACVDPVLASSTATSLYPAALNGAMGRLGWEAGKTYTVAATLHLEEPQAGELDPMARRIAVGVTYPGGVNVGRAFPSVAAPNERGTHRLAVSFTLPENAENAFIRLMNGSTTTRIWWDELQIDEGITDGTYRDGNSSGCKWEGDKNASKTITERATYGIDHTAGISLQNGVVRIPNRGDALSRPILDLRGPLAAGLTIHHPGGTWTLTSPLETGGYRWTLDGVEGQLFGTSGQRFFNSDSGPAPVVEPGGSTWTITGISGSGAITARRVEAWT